MNRLLGCFFVVAFFVVVSLNIRGQSPQPISIDVMPRMFVCNSWSRMQVRVIMRAEPNQDNRFLHFAYTSDVGESGSSLTEMKGINSSISYTRYVWVNCNYYLFSACVLRTQGKKFCAKQEVYPP